MSGRLGFLFGLCLSALAGQAQAWGPVGHKTAALIAQDRLSPKARKAVRDILGKDTGLDQISYCADVILHSDRAIRCGGAFMVEPDTARATSRWHFIDIPISAKPSAASLADYCPRQTECVTAQIQRNLGVLGNPRSSRRDKQLALMFVVHFVGDEHAPLHCASDRDDAGGNLKTVRYQGRSMNLHHLWDSALDDPRAREGATWDVKAKILFGKLKADLKSRPAAEVASWTQGDMVSQAALESFAISRDVIYPQYRRDRGRDLGDRYRDRMRPVAYKRIEMAGVRLAVLLNQSLDLVLK